MNQTLATDTLTRSMTEVVDALHGSAFPAALVRLIQQQVAFDCALLLGVGLRPVYLYDNLHHQRALLFDRYLIPIGLNIRSVLSNLGYKVTSPAPHRQ